MKTYKVPLIIGFVLALLLLAIGLTGYSIVIYYAWPIILIVLLLLGFATINRPLSFRILTAASTVKRQSYLVALAILVSLSVSGALAGHYGRRLHCLRVCRSCDPMIQLIQKHHTEHGTYPEILSSVQGFALAQSESGLRINQGRFLDSGISLDGINSNDALFYFETNYFLCLVPVTKTLPMSFTRFYVYGWSSDKPEWKYDKLIWYIMGR